MKKLYGERTLGILGGGQLGQMLIQSAINYNIPVHIMDPDSEAPCRYLCKEFTTASLLDYEAVYRFGKQVDILTIEIEKVNTDALEKLEAEGISVYPQPHIIRIIQDKGLQKKFFLANNIPTADFELINSPSELTGSRFAYPYIQKLRKDGYDGRGVKKIRSETDLPEAFTQPSLIEQFIDFDKEISVIVARNTKGEMACFPTVEMQFHPTANLVEFLISPAIIDELVEKQAQSIAKKTAETLGITGLLAVEMFISKDGKVLVNEVAPRPHNSGHQTIEGNLTSQFDQHLRSIFGFPLGETANHSVAVMINLLGEPGYEGAAYYEGMEEILALKGVYVHLYGKALTRPFRKMGHVTITDSVREKAIEKARFVQRTIKVKA